MNSETNKAPGSIPEFIVSPEFQRIVRHGLVALAGVLGLSAATEPTFSPLVDALVSFVILLVTYGWSRMSDGKSAVPSVVPGVLPVVALCLLMVGCQSVGTSVKTDPKTAEITGVSAPVVFNVQNDTQRGTVTATGPSGYVTTESTEAFFANSPPQAISFSDGRRTVTLSGAANLQGKKLKFNADDSVEIGEFSTVPSEVIKASNEGVIGTSGERIALTQAQRDALIAQVQASETIAAEMKPALISLIEGLFAVK